MKRIRTIAILLFLSNLCYSQIDSSLIWKKAIYDSTADFYEICELQDQYFQTHPDPDADESGPRREFYRWSRYWNHRVDYSDGQTASITKALRNYQSIYNRLGEIYSPTDNPASDWYYLGPKGLATQHYGIVTCVKFDRNDQTLQTYYAGTGSSGLWKTNDGGNTWRNITGQYLVEGLGVCDILIHPTNPEIIYIGIGFSGMNRPFYYGKGIMKTSNGGISWETVLTFNPSDKKTITKLVMDPADPNRILAFGANYIYKTTDGINWSLVPNIPPNFCTSGSINWVAPKIVKDVVFKPGSSNIIYVATDFVSTLMAEVWKIENVFSPSITGNDFTQINTLPLNGLTNCNRFSLDIKAGANGIPDVLYCGALSNATFSIFSIDLTTSTFIPYCSISPGSMSASQCEFEMSDLVENSVIVCDHYFRYYHNDWATWAQKFDNNTNGNDNEQIYHTDTRSLDYIKQGSSEYMLIGNDGGVTRVIKNSASVDYIFSNVNGRGLYITQFYGLGICKAYPDKFAAGAQDNRILSHNYSGQPWQVSDFTGDGYEVVIHPQNPDYAYFITGDGTLSSIKRTQDGFQSLNNYSIVNKINENENFNEKPIVLKPDDPAVAFVGYQNVYKSPDWNSNFELFFDRSTLAGLIQDESIVDIAMAPLNNQYYMYVAYDNKDYGTGNCLIRTTNADATNPTWSVIPDVNLNNCPHNLGITHVAVAPDNPEKLWVTFGRFWNQPNMERVLQSNDGGSTFIDITSRPPHNLEGLPNLPVNCIKVTGNSSVGYKLFIGNDIGVYLYDTQQVDPEWKLFSNHLPPAIITNIEHVQVSGQPESLRIATFGYGIWETPLDCSRGDYEVISTAVTWGTDRIKHNNVYIANGGSLTITAKISFVEGTGLIVREGGQLRVNGGTLTSACGSLWNGIIVHGDAKFAITNLYHQGYCELNNAKIENAIAGVRTLGGMPEDVDGGVVPIEEIYPAGGIILATNTVFRNNYNCVYISPYASGKIDKFQECIFEVTNELLPPYNTSGPLVKLNDVNKVSFQGCTFRTSKSFSPNQSIGTGILSINSTFYVDALCKAVNQNECTQWMYSKFANLDYGIRALAFSPTRTFRVDRATVDSNNTGIYASGISAAQITRSTFIVNKVDTLSRDHFGGLYLDYCSGYKVEENNFTANILVPNSWAIGTVVNNSNLYPFETADNKIYNNTFNNLEVGILAQNRNKSGDGLNGLTLKCNDFSNTRKYDIAVTTYNPVSGLMGIKNVQGIYSQLKADPAGNTFSDHSGVFWNFDYRYHNEAMMGFTYNHHDPTLTPTEFRVDLGLNGIYCTANITPTKVLNNGYPSKSDCCPSSLSPSGGGGGIEDVKAAISSSGFGIDSTQNLLNLLVDGGSTTQLTMDVQTSIPPEAVPLYDELMAKSPYLSDTVIVTAVNKEDVITSSMITEILSANPQAAKSEALMGEVDNRLNPLTSDQISQIMEGLTTLGGKEILESQKAGYQLDHAYALNTIVRYYMNDTLCTNPIDSITYFLSNSPYIWGRYQEAFFRNETGDSNVAMGILTTIPQEFDLSPVLQTEHQNFTLLLEMEHTTIENNESLLQADSMQVLNINAIEQGSEGLMKVYARNLLYGIQGATDYTEPYQLPQSGLKDSRIRWVRSPLNTSNSLKLYPNPARSYVIAEYFLKEQNTNCILTMYNNAGIVLKELPVAANHGYTRFMVDDLPSGLYLCKLVCGRETLDAVKLIITK